MKKKIIKKLLYVVIIISILCNVIQLREVYSLKKEVEEYASNISPEYEYLDSLTVKSFENAVQSGNSFVAFIGRPDCGDCIYFEPTLKYLSSKYDLSNKIMYVNVKRYREENQERWESFKSKYGFTQTPSFLYFENGKCVSEIEWGEDGLPLEEVLQWLNENNII